MFIYIYLFAFSVFSHCVWCFFSRHNLPDRMRKGEDVFYFCFYLLPYLAGVQFSYPFLSGIHHTNGISLRRTPSPDGSDGGSPDGGGSSDGGSPDGGGSSDGGGADLRQSEMSSTSSSAPVPIVGAEAAVLADTTVIYLFDLCIS